MGIILFLLSCAIIQVKSQIMTFDKTTFHGLASTRDLVYESIYSTAETPYYYDTPFIDFDLRIHSNERDQLAFLVLGNRNELMYEDRLNLTLQACRNEKMTHKNFVKQKINFNGTNFAETKGKIFLYESGLYTAVFVPCQNGITVTGKIRFKNSYGYVSAHKFPYFDYYNIVMSVYMILWLVWFIVTYKRQNVYTNQQVINMVLIFTTLESFFNSLEIHYLNHYGVRSGFLYFFARIFSIFEKVFARLALILASCGYGLIDFKLSGLRKKLIQTLPAIYAVLNLTVDTHYFENRHIYEHKTGFEHTVVFFIYLLDVCFYVWTLMEIMNTLELKECKEKYVMNQYKLFAGFMAASFLSSVVFCFWEINYMHFSVLSHENWMNFWWYESGFWRIQFTFVLVCIMYLWRPSEKLKYESLKSFNNETISAEEGIDENTAYNKKLGDLERGLRRREEHRTEQKSLKKDSEASSEDLDQQMEDLLKGDVETDSEKEVNSEKEGKEKINVESAENVGNKKEKGENDEESDGNDGNKKEKGESDEESVKKDENKEKIEL